MAIPEGFQNPGYDIASQAGLMWELVKAPVIVPLLNLGVYICLAMSLMLFMERLYMGVVIILVKLFWKKPDKRYNFQPIQDDVELGSSNFPVVLVQIPMFNEREVRLFRFASLRFGSVTLSVSNTTVKAKLTAKVRSTISTFLAFISSPFFLLRPPLKLRNFLFNCVHVTLCEIFKGFVIGACLCENDKRVSSSVCYIYIYIYEFCLRL